jgi:ketosteroid isomerase-like protein
MAARPKAPLATLMASADEIEAQFYEALQSADIDKLMALWVQDEFVRCIHPGGAVLVGSSAIKASFEALFARGPIAVEAAEVHRLPSDQLTLHQVHERILVPDSDGGSQVAWVIATNAYLKTSLGWRMVLHHASPGQVLELPAVHDGNANVLH